MKVSSPLKYTDVSENQYEQFRRIAKSHGLNITGSKDTENLDGIGIGVEYSKDKSELTFTCHVPVWMAEATAVGIIHTMVCEAMAQEIAQKQADAAKQYSQDHPAEQVRHDDAAIRRAQEPGTDEDAATHHNRTNGHAVKESGEHAASRAAAHPAQHASVRR